MTSRRKKLIAFLERDREGDRGETECEDEEKPRTHEKDIDGERGQDREEAHQEGHQRNPRERTPKERGRGLAEDSVFARNSGKYER